MKPSHTFLTGILTGAVLVAGLDAFVAKRTTSTVINNQREVIRIATVQSQALTAELAIVRDSLDIQLSRYTQDSTAWRLYRESERGVFEAESARYQDEYENLRSHLGISLQASLDSLNRSHREAIRSLTFQVQSVERENITLLELGASRDRVIDTMSRKIQADSVLITNQDTQIHNYENASRRQKVQTWAERVIYVATIVLILK